MTTWFTWAECKLNENKNISKKVICESEKIPKTRGRKTWITMCEKNPMSREGGGRGSVDHPMADLFSRNIYDLGYPKGLKNGNFNFFCQISSSSRPFLLIFCQNFFFQKIDLYPFNFELSCSHQFLTENDPPYHFGKGRCILRC